jgi:hypothetical protein
MHHERPNEVVPNVLDLSISILCYRAIRIRLVLI